MQVGVVVSRIRSPRLRSISAPSYGLYRKSSESSNCPRSMVQSLRESKDINIQPIEEHNAIVQTSNGNQYFRRAVVEHLIRSLLVRS